MFNKSSWKAFVKSHSKSSKECENLLKNKIVKFQSVYENFCKEKATHLEARVWTDMCNLEIHMRNAQKISFGGTLALITIRELRWSMVLGI
ncbi:hypothetical protein M9H77_26767 [Catharanthus roseus]|uniref:Uncharacterized protein n=1 Tax=Catharanthus roseus TaxID=4058 RepID=A0ACC0ACS0_CATRO|nr:hypothetical protein M9H77_26767 [Catharanthus roseus]